MIIIYISNHVHVFNDDEYVIMKIVFFSFSISTWSTYSWMISIERFEMIFFADDNSPLFWKYIKRIEEEETMFNQKQMEISKKKKNRCSLSLIRSFLISQIDLHIYLFIVWKKAFTKYLFSFQSISISAKFFFRYSIRRENWHIRSKFSLNNIDSR